MSREEQLKQEYESKLSALRNEQSRCQHEWEPVKYDPEKIAVPIYRDAFKGSDYCPELIGMEAKEKERWSRTCKKCGKVEYTYEKVAVKYEPKFD